MAASILSNSRSSCLSRGLNENSNPEIFTLWVAAGKSGLRYQASEQALLPAPQIRGEQPAFPSRISSLRAGTSSHTPAGRTVSDTKPPSGHFHSAIRVGFQELYRLRYQASEQAHLPLCDLLRLRYQASEQALRRDRPVSDTKPPSGHIYGVYASQCASSSPGLRYQASERALLRKRLRYQASERALPHQQLIESQIPSLRAGTSHVSGARAAPTYRATPICLRYQASEQAQPQRVSDTKPLSGHFHAAITSKLAVSDTKPPSRPHAIERR
jgi:hypothetical protein